MKLNHRERHALRHCLLEGTHWTQAVTYQQNNTGGKADQFTTNQANLWRNRFMRYYFKLHPDA